MENALITTREKFNGLSSAIVLQFHLSLGGDGCFEPVYIRDVCVCLENLYFPITKPLINLDYEIRVHSIASEVSRLIRI